MQLNAEEWERRKARYFHDDRGKTDEPESEGYSWDDERMFRELEAAEVVLGAVIAADDGGWLHPTCTGGDCRLAGIRNALIRWRGFMSESEMAHKGK